MTKKEKIEIVTKELVQSMVHKSRKRSKRICESLIKN
jgi:hypothetical protein